MKLSLFVLAALCGYVFAGLNPAIAISRAVYKTDIRECGSGNPGFTNFKRTFGGRLAWLVMVLDLSKAAVVTVLFSLILFICILGFVCFEKIAFLPIIVLVLCLLIPYIAHYFFLENKTQYLYSLYEKYTKGDKDE